jgi:exosome complex RNA-binding protein Csl4
MGATSPLAQEEGKMKYAGSPHKTEVLALINSVEDRDVQNEMLEISSKYAQALAGMRLAKNYLEQIDDETGTDHSDTFALIYDAINNIKYSEIALLQMTAEI